jgi:hypothetical protein
MSKIALASNADGTGTFTIASPNSNSDRTLNLPDNSGTVITTASEGAVGTTNITDAAVTLTKLASSAQPIGTGQTWQNVSASRAQNVTYTNTTGKPIMVHLNGAGSTENNAVRLIVNNVTMRFKFDVAQGAGQVIVPAGATYIGFFPNALYEWCELR